MKNKITVTVKIMCVLLSVILAAGLSGTSALAKSNTYTESNLQKTIDGILSYQQKQAEVAGVQELLDTSLTDNAGANSSDWFIIALARYRNEYHYDSYLKALETYTLGIKNAKATDYQRIALVYSALNQNADEVKSIINHSIGQLGIISYIYGLILLDSGTYPDKDYPREDIINSIRKLQLSDGGWALNGKVSDIDVTAMALQSLAPYTNDSKVMTAVNKALALLSKRQLDTGDYKSWGTRCSESTAQVITALASLDIDILKDKRFIKKDKTLLDGLLLYKHKDGSFSHTIDGRSDYTASVQAMYSLIAVWRQWKGLSSFYDFADTGWTVSAAVSLQSDQKNTGQMGEGQSTTGLSLSEARTTERSASMNYRTIITIIVLAMTALILGISYVVKKRSRKLKIVVLTAAGIILAAVWGLKFQTVDDYYQTKQNSNSSDANTVLISIRCDTVAGKNENIPKDGIILDRTKLPVNEGDSVLDVLILAAKQKKIPLDYEGGENASLRSSYVNGIDDIFEDDFGSQSGWLYRVNNEFPGTACGDYKVGAGDLIEWVYTCDLGKDVGRQ